MISFKPIDCYTDLDLSTAILTSLLKKGSLCLFIGAGVSQSTLQFPGWYELVKACMDTKGLDSSVIQENTPIDTLLKSMEKVKNKCADFEEYKEVIKNKLHFEFKMDYTHAKNLLLISLGALVMNSKRGSIREIVTYNFDDLLEWYLDCHGFKIQVITEYPFLSEEADVHIFHPHGFLPKSTKYKSAQNLLFDSFSYDINIGNQSSYWYKECNHLLLQKIGLMVGLSGEDPALRSLVSNTYDELKRNKLNRPVAFLLNKKSSMTNDLSWYNDRGIVPLGFNEFDDIWSFLLKVCQNAAESG